MQIYSSDDAHHTSNFDFMLYICMRISLRNRGTGWN